jgi:hypothetical protein
MTAGKSSTILRVPSACEQTGAICAMKGLIVHPAR